jgi:hypothetical protein
VIDIDNSERSIQAGAQKCIGSCPLFVNESFNCSARQYLPQTSLCHPFLLEEGCESGIVEPQKPKVGIVLQRVFNQTDALKIFIIQPIHVCMSVLSVAGTPVDLTTIHIPQIRDNIHIVFYDVSRETCVENTRIEERLHYSKETTTFTSW